MTKKVIVLKDTDRIEEAVRQLKEKRITGAPVVDDAGKFVGLLSISDLVDRRKSLDDQEETPAAPLAHGEDNTTWDLFEKAHPLNEDASSEAVRARMSKQVTSITSSAPIVEVARLMCSGHWHRVPVVDEVGSLVGIISTMDILAAVVNTSDESV